jgi:hypothetical protein
MSAQYFAQVTDGVVTRVAVVQQSFWKQTLTDIKGTWIEIFFDTEGKTYAGIGYTYDPATQDFTAPPAPAPMRYKCVVHAG